MYLPLASTCDVGEKYDDGSDNWFPVSRPEVMARRPVWKSKRFSGGCCCCCCWCCGNNWLFKAVFGGFFSGDEEGGAEGEAAAAEVQVCLPR